MPPVVGILSDKTGITEIAPVDVVDHGDKIPQNQSEVKSYQTVPDLAYTMRHIV